MVSGTLTEQRDRVYGTVEWEDWNMIVVDTGGMLGDTDEWSSGIHQQAEVRYISLIHLTSQAALEEADLILFMVDVNKPLDHKEKKLALEIRNRKKPTILISNKVDNSELEAKSEVFVRLGLGEPVSTSAVHGLGEVTLLETIVETLDKEGTINL